MRAISIGLLMTVVLGVGSMAQETAGPTPVALLQAHLVHGRYQEAAEQAEAYLAENPDSADIWNALGEAQLAVGKLEQAEQAFQQALSAATGKRLTAELNLALLTYRRGRRDQAQNEFERILDYYRGQSVWSSADLTAVAEAVSYLGRTRPAMYRAAVQLYSNAISVDAGNLRAQVKLGNLLLDKYNNTEALDVFREVLASHPKHPEALLGLARSQHFDHSAEALETVQQALEANPNLVPALVFLTRLHIESEHYPDAKAAASKALDINPASLEALTVLAALHYLQRDDEAFAKVLRQTFALNPRYAELYNTLAEVAARNRLYSDAVGHAAKAVELDSRSWRGFGLLGMNQLRVGDIVAGRQNLETAFLGDPYNVWVKNTLDLVDTFGDYALVDSEYFRFMIHSDEARALGPYLQPLATEVFEEFVERYEYRPRTPIRIELYPRHADFSVRTVGLAGLGALGVSFGPVVALDSPSAKDKGHFNWGSTLRHELAHSFHLGLSDHRVPRWFSEGLAVHEERRSRPGWGQDVTPSFLEAMADDRLLPVSRLNDGFVRPEEPQQVIHSYYQASLVIELIEQEWGFQALREMLVSYADGSANTEVLERVLGVGVEAFDERFAEHLQVRFAGPLEALTQPLAGEAIAPETPQAMAERAALDSGNFPLQMEAARVLLEAGELDSAEVCLQRAKALFPEYAGGDSPYWQLALLYRKRGDIEGAIDQLESMVAINAEHYAAHMMLAELLESKGESRRAAEILDRGVYIHPFEIGMHETLARLYATLDEWPLAAREYQAVIALEPVDLAAARYKLADAHFAAGDVRGARREVLRTLELAPHYEDAQDLLLEIREFKPSAGAGTESALGRQDSNSTPTIEAGN